HPRQLRQGRQGGQEVDRGGGGGAAAVPRPGRLPLRAADVQAGGDRQGGDVRPGGRRQGGRAGAAGLRQEGPRRPQGEAAAAQRDHLLDLLPQVFSGHHALRDEGQEGTAHRGGHGVPVQGEVNPSERSCGGKFVTCRAKASYKLAATI